MPTREQRALVEVYARQAREMRAVLLQTLLTLWRGMGSWRDADQPRFVEAAVPRVLGAQRQMASLTESFLVLLLGDMLGGRVRPVGVQAPTVSRLRGVDPEVVYARPYKTLYTSLGEGRTFTQAMGDAERRLTQIAATDLQLAKTHTARDVLGGVGRVVGYKRVLVGDRSCGLCVVASTQRYRKAQLMPIHPGCDCAVAPIVGDQDPGQVINDDRLEDVHDAIEATFGRSAAAARGPIDYRDVLVEHVHGEIGPVLARRGDHFTGPDEVRDRS